jgi:hypothetical protein
MPGAVHQPRFGELRFRGSDDGYVTEVIEIPALRGHRCELLFQDYVDDPDRGQIDAAIEALFAPGADLLALARPHVAQYREDMLAFFAEQEIEVDVAALPEPDAIWSQVQLGKTCLVSRRAKGDDDDGIYMSFECECDWEPEHGLQVVIRDGTSISKVSAYDGHVTNADSFANPKLVGIVYVTREMSETLLASP